MKQQKIFLKDYKAPTFSVSSINLEFQLHEDVCRVISTTQIEALTSERELRLDGEDLRLVSVKIDGVTWIPGQYQLGENELILSNVPARFTLEIETALEPQNNTSLEGLYKSNGIYSTQCEAQGFRKITYFLDRPDVMTSYSVVIEADKKKYPVLLSNGDRIKVEEVGSGRHRAYWRDPHKKPCYLFALVAGDLGVIRDTFTTRSGRSVNLEVYAAHGKQERCHHAMDSLKKSMKWDEDTFGLEYDLNDYMIVAIDDFNAGAMENKGLNIFNSRLVLADSESATDQDFHNIESVVAHEYFHNWTGNRVTVCNWFQLSLKEGLTVFRDQEFSADMTDRGVQRIHDVDSLRAGQFAEDAGPNSHPVRPESCMAVDNFFTMTIYEKGAELIRMMQTIVGRKGFRKGMDEYFKRHDGQAVTTEDFAAAISEPNGKDFTQFKKWYSQAGTPQVRVLEKYDGTTQKYHLTLEQTGLPEAFHIPLLIELLDSQGRECTLNSEKVTVNSDGQHLLELKNLKEEFVFSGLAQRPVLSILRQFSAPVNLHWEAQEEDLYFILQKDTDSFNRWEMAQKLSLRVLRQLIQQQRQGSKDLQVDKRFLAAMKAIIADNSMDPAFKAAMLHLPGQVILAQEESVYQAEIFHTARQTLLKTLAQENREAFLEIYKRYHGVDATSRNTKVFGHRSLKNQALAYLSLINSPELHELVVQQYYQAQNMTDRMTAMTLMADSQHSERATVLADFHAKWQHDSLVLNKWLAAQAISSQAGALNEVIALSQHPSFNMGNPNNVYSLLRTFAHNLPQFYGNEGRAFAFMADKIIELDAKNPQVAARLCQAFNFVGKLEGPLKEKALQEIRRIVAVDSLSKNSRELLETSLH
ncbi:MAG: aminopeptidase N [Bdellovibrio sp.]